MVRENLFFVRGENRIVGGESGERMTRARQN